MKEHLQTAECIECGYQFPASEIIIEATIDCPNCGEETAKPL